MSASLRPLALAAAAASLAGPLAAQARPAPGGGCRMEVTNLDREGSRVQVLDGVINYFAGGNVRIRCVNQPVFMWSDSVASYQGRVVQFVGSVRYRDETTEMTADFGTYFRDNDKWEARGNVVLTNRKDGSILQGPMLDYYRAIPGQRDTTELYADSRPTMTLRRRDSLGRPDEPYVVVGQWVRQKGDDRTWAVGRVTIDRSDFRGRGDSLFLDTGAGSRGVLAGRATLERTATDSFLLRGSRIDFTLDDRELTFVVARDTAHLSTPDLTLDGDAIALDIAQRKVEQTLAWGSRIRPVAKATDYEARGDSLAFDTPGQQLREIRAFRNGWLGTGSPADSTEDRDWVAGDTVVAHFVARDSAGTSRAALQRLEAAGDARAYYRLRQTGQARASLTYTRARRITVTMRVQDALPIAVDSVFALGVEDGVHLQPVAIRPDTTRADTTGTDTTAVRRPPGPARPESRRR